MLKLLEEKTKQNGDEFYKDLNTNLKRVDAELCKTLITTCEEPMKLEKTC